VRKVPNNINIDVNRVSLMDVSIHGIVEVIEHLCQIKYVL